MRNLTLISCLFLFNCASQVGYQCQEPHKSAYFEKCADNCSGQDWCIDECDRIALKKYCKGI